MRRALGYLLNRQRPTAARSAIWLITGNGYGSTNTKIRRFTTVQKNIGSDITLTQSAADGDSMTINKSGTYFVYYQDKHSAAETNMGISINSSELTTSIGSVAAANVLARFTNLAAVPCCAGIVVNLVAGDVLRAHTDGSATATGETESMFKVEKVG